MKFRVNNRVNNKITLCVNKTSKHIYAQIISEDGSKTLASISSIGAKLANGGNIEAATKIGELIAKASKKKSITKIAFDRSGFKYHGRIKALADSARKHGLEF